MKIGDRVIVHILDKQRWATGAADALEGAHGKIIAGPAWPTGFDDISSFLVEFDEPRPPWWSGQSPSLAHWFAPSELIQE